MLHKARAQETLITRAYPAGVLSEPKWEGKPPTPALFSHLVPCNRRKNGEALVRPRAQDTCPPEDCGPTAGLQDAFRPRRLCTTLLKAHGQQLLSSITSRPPPHKQLPGIPQGKRGGWNSLAQLQSHSQIRQPRRDDQTRNLKIPTNTLRATVGKTDNTQEEMDRAWWK